MLFSPDSAAKDGVNIFDVKTITLSSQNVQELGEQFIRAWRLQKPEAPFSLGGTTAGISITSASLDKNSQVYKELEHMTWAHNQTSFVQKVAMCGQAVLDGLFRGAKRALDHVIEHPKATVVNIAVHTFAGKYMLAYHLAKEGYQLAKIGYVRYKNQEEGKCLWKDYTQPIRDFLGQFTNPTIPLAQKITLGACIFTQWEAENLLFKKVSPLCERIKVNLAGLVGHRGRILVCPKDAFKNDARTHFNLKNGNKGNKQISPSSHVSSKENSNVNLFNAKYEDAGYHTLKGNSIKSARPLDGQKALDFSVEVPGYGKRRIGISSGQFVVLSYTQKDLYHGHVRAWEELTDEMQKTLLEYGYVSRKGKIIKEEFLR